MEGIFYFALSSEPNPNLTLTSLLFFPFASNVASNVASFLYGNAHLPTLAQAICAGIIYRVLPLPKKSISITVPKLQRKILFAHV